MSLSAEILCRSLQNEAVVRFVHSAMSDGYQEFFTDYPEHATMLAESFDRLVQSQKNGIDPDELLRTTYYLTEFVFRKPDTPFWHNQIYKHYKQHIQPENDFQRIKRFIKGATVLDFGCGGGYLALRIAKDGYEVCATDILDYRFDDAKHVPFAQMTSPVDIPFPEGSIGTTVLQTVLHHIDGENIPSVLNALNKITSRLLIKEDTFDLPQELELQQRVLAQSLLNSFTSLSRENQFQSLVLNDYFANAISLGIPNMNLPFQFKSVSEWKELLRMSGWEIVDICLTGYENHRMHKSCQVWLVCDRFRSRN